MPQPPTQAVLAHENTRNLPALSQKTFFSAAAGAAENFRWEFDLGLRITDPNQFISTNPAPISSATIAGGGAGPQTTPQPAIGPWLDWLVFTNGAAGGGVVVAYAADANPCSYQNIFQSDIPSGLVTNSSGLRATGRFVLFQFQNFTAGARVEVGFYVRSWT